MSKSCFVWPLYRYLLAEELASVLFRCCIRLTCKLSMSMGSRDNRTSLTSSWSDNGSSLEPCSRSSSVKSSGSESVLIPWSGLGKASGGLDGKSVTSSRVRGEFVTSFRRGIASMTSSSAFPELSCDCSWQANSQSSSSWLRCDSLDCFLSHSSWKAKLTFILSDSGYGPANCECDYVMF